MEDVRQSIDLMIETIKSVVWVVRYHFCNRDNQHLCWSRAYFKI